MTASIKIGTTAKVLLLQVKAGEIEKKVAAKFLGSRINKKFEQAQAIGEIWILAHKQTYDAFAELTGLTDNLLLEHKQTVNPDYDPDYHKNKRAAKQSASKPASTDGTTATSTDGDKPEKTEQELIDMYATRSEKQLRNWFSKANPDGIKYPLLEAEIKRRESGTLAAKPEKKAAKKPAKKVASKVEPKPAQTVDSAADMMASLMADSDNMTDDQKAAYNHFLATMQK